MSWQIAKYKIHFTVMTGQIYMSICFVILFIKFYSILFQIIFWNFASRSRPRKQSWGLVTPPTGIIPLSRRKGWAVNGGSSSIVVCQQPLETSAKLTDPQWIISVIFSVGSADHRFIFSNDFGIDFGPNSPLFEL